MSLCGHGIENFVKQTQLVVNLLLCMENKTVKRINSHFDHSQLQITAALKYGHISMYNSTEI